MELPEGVNTRLPGSILSSGVFLDSHFISHRKEVKKLKGGGRRQQISSRGVRRGCRIHGIQGEMFFMIRSI
jgi:hypothetical protein